MKASELKNYKTLDITKISGTPWNTAEKVLGLDESDKVVMAETEESVSPEYVENAISEAMEAETSRTESTYAKKSEVTGYTTTEEVNQAIETAMEAETARTENTYAKPADIPSLDGYAKTTAVTEEIQTAIAAETARTEDVYAKKSEIPDLDNYYTKSETDEAIEEAISGISLDGYWTSGQTKTYVDSEITAATSDLATKEDVFGVTAVTELNVLETDSDWAFASSSTGTKIYLKNTSISKYKAVNLGDYLDTSTDTYNLPFYSGNTAYYIKLGTPYIPQDPDDIGVTEYKLGVNGGSDLLLLLSYLDGTYNYYILLDTERLSLVLYKTLPASFTEITGKKANIEDLPTAQDESDVKTYVYNAGDGSNKDVLSKVEIGDNQTTQTNYRAYKETLISTKWGGNVASSYLYFVPGNEVIPGIKTVRDSAVIDNSENALSGFTEEITLTLGEDSTDYLVTNGGNKFFKNTDNQRYLATQTSSFSTTTSISSATINSVTYYPSNGIPENLNSSFRNYGTYQFSTFGNTSLEKSVIRFRRSNIAYLIYDKELNNLILSDSLTITRTKNIKEALDNLDLTDYAKTTAVTADIASAMAAETARTENTYAKPGDIPSLDGYWTSAQTQNAITAATQDMATKTWVGEQGYLTQHQDISGKLDKTDFNAYTGATATAIAAKQDALVSGTNIKTINNQSILGSGNIDIQGGSGPIIPAITSQTDYEAISGDVKTGDLIQVWDVDINDNGNGDYGLFQAYVDQGSISWERKDNTDSILWNNKDYPWMADNGVCPVDFGENAFLISTDDTSEDEAYNGIGFDDNGKPVTTHIVPEYDEQTGEVTGITREDKPILTDDGSIVRYDIDREAELANAGYNTKLVTQEYDENEGATLPTIVGYMEEGMLNGVKIDGHSIAKVSGYIHQQSEPTPGPVFEFIQNDELATQAYVTAATENLASQGYVDAAITAATNDLATEAYVTAATATKQDTLVSGTNIKTINNQSLLGSGNIDIQGGGGGGSVVELTQAQYDALDPPAQDTTYIITDAETVDLNDYAMASGLTELSGTVETISSNYATKQNVTARASSNANPYLPGWNSEGVITGSSQVYSVGMSINGSNQAGLLRGSNSDFPGFYAPTSAGTAGQPLLSNGSGAPVWGGYKFAFITQTAYDALATKDSTTIYFITGD